MIVELVEDWVAQGKNLITGFGTKDSSDKHKWNREERKYYIEPIPYIEK